MEYNFDWDPSKDRMNRQKHKISFRQAASVFRDPNQLTIYDEEHSEDEDRWITIGIHTFERSDSETIEIRIISARKAVGDEIEQYRSGI